jgi:hypothetical protein
MDGYVDRQRGSIERQDACLRTNAHAHGRRQDEGLVDAAGTQDAMHCLNLLADADGLAVE